MQLILEPGGTIDNPDHARVSDELNNLHNQGGEFAIVTNDAMGDEFYMQTAGGSGGGYVLEYREGGEHNHFVCTDVDLNIERVVVAFQKYSVGDDSWKNDFTWEKMEFGKSKSGCLGMIVLFLTGVGIWSVLPF